MHLINPNVIGTEKYAEGIFMILNRYLDKILIDWVLTLQETFS